MGKISWDSKRYSKEYLELLQKTYDVNDYNDCSVKSVTIATGEDYENVHKFLEDCGRKRGKGISTHYILLALKHFGYNYISIQPEKFIERYPGCATLLKNVTTHHMDRYPDIWRDGNTYLLFTRGHVAAVVNGVNHDHTKGRPVRVNAIYKIIKQES